MSHKCSLPPHPRNCERNQLESRDAAVRAPWKRLWKRAAALAALALAAASSGAQSNFPARAVGTPVTQAVTVTATAAGTVNSVEVLTLGAPSGDFAAGAGLSTCGTTTFAAPGATCTQRVAFTPAAPGLRVGAVVLLDATGKLLGETPIYGTGTGGLAVLVPGNTLPFAGNGSYLDAVQDGILALNAELYSPAGVAMDGAGNLYIADSQHNRIRMVCGASGTATINGVGISCAGKAGQIFTVAGGGTVCGGAGDLFGDDCPATQAVLDQPGGIALDGAGNLYIADTGNNVIREVSAATGVISIAAGNSAGLHGYAGDGTSATLAGVFLYGPQGVAVDAAGDIFVADTNNQVIRVVCAVASGPFCSGETVGDIYTLAGEYYGPFGNGVGGYNGDGGLATASTLNLPYGLAFDAAGDVLIADTGNNRIREINAATLKISTVAGDGTPGFSGDNAAAILAELDAPTGIALDPAGDLYIGDTQNSRIRKVNAASGFISTLAVGGNEYLVGTDTLDPVAVKGPQGLIVDVQGDVFFANTEDMRVWEIESNLAALDFTATPIRQGNVSAAKFQTVENDGNDVATPLAFTSIAAGTNAEIDTAIGAGECVTTTPLAVDGECTVGVYFAPAAAPALAVNTTEVGTVSAAYNTVAAIAGPNSPLAIVAVGVAEPLNGTTTTVSATPDPSLYGQAVTFTVTVTTGAGTGNLTGTVTIADTFNGGTVNLAQNLALTLNGAGDQGTATFITSTLAVGVHTIVVTYAGDPQHGPSSSIDNGVSPWSQIVEEQTSIALVSSANPSQVGQSVTFTATVTAPDGGGILPDGQLSFLDGTTSLATVQLVGGVAAYTTSTLTAGAHPITAVYAGDDTKEILGETSQVLTQDVQAAATLVVTPSVNPSHYGNPVTFTATITSGATTPASGTVNFYDNGGLIGSGTLSAGAADTATFTAAALAVGTHPIFATYAGDSFNSAATSATISQVVAQTLTSDTVAATPNPGVQGTAETITDTVNITNGAGTPTGTVTFTSGTTVLGTANLTTAGTATINPALAPGTYSIVATYSGDTDDAGSQSAPLALTVENSSATAVTSTPDPSLFGQTVTFTVQVTSGAGGAIPTGTVTLFDTYQGVKNTLAAALPLNAAGTATYTTATLAIGTHSITASYGGDTTHAASTSTDNGASPWLQVVDEQTSVALTTSVNPSQVGQAVTFTATVTALNGGNVPPDGTVIFQDGTTTLATVTLAGGVATYTTSTLANGLHPITAVYSGDAPKAILGETSAVIDQIVQTLATIAVTTSGSPSYYGAPVTFTATIASGATVPASGTVTFYDNGVLIGSGTLSGAAPDTATFTTSALAVGTHPITAHYGGDNYNAAAQSLAPINQVVVKTVTAVALTAAPNPGTAGVAETLTATVTVTQGGGTPTGLVTFTAISTTGTIVQDTANLNTSGVATISLMLAPGTYSVVATYAGDTNDGGSQSAPLSLTINQATTTTTLMVSPDPSTYLSPVTFTAVVAGNGAIPTGTVEFFASGTLIGAGTLNTSGVAIVTYANLAIGTYTITAVYEGDVNDAGSTSAPVSLTVGKIPTTTDLGSTTTGGANPQVDVVATVFGNVGPTPTGTVTFTDATATLGTATLDSSGVATLVLNLPSGTYAVFAVYSGDALHQPSTSQPITVVVAPVTFTMTVSPTTFTLKTTQYGVAGLVLTSLNGFTDTIDLGCLGLPAGLTCHFSSPSVTLAANGSAIAQLTIDTNSPLTGGSEAMYRHAGRGGAMLAGVLLPFGVLFGWIFRRQRKRLAAVFTIALLIALSTVALVATGCSGISASSATPGNYTIEVVGSGTTTGVTVTQFVTVTVTQ